MGDEPNSSNSTQPLEEYTLPVQRLVPGAILEGRYQIDEIVGSGGMGAVYRARDLHFSNVAKWVAVKEMVNLCEDAEESKKIQENFEREANLLASLNHPAIPRIYDYFSRSLHSYLVMDFIIGKNLEKLVREADGFFAEQQVIQWAVELCSVLDFLHTHQPDPIIFRDMKPTNIIVNPLQQVVLVDFGIARPFRVGQKATVVGTEGYSPPEQYRGVISPLMDIYALGATLHHLLTLKSPQLEPPFTFSERPVHLQNPSVSPNLEAVIEKALQYKPEDRFQTAHEMQEALLSITTNERLFRIDNRPVIKQEKSEEIQPLWAFECEDEIRGTPLIKNGAVYVGSYDNNLYALNAATGEFIWKYPTGGAIVGRPAADDASIYLGSMDGNIYSIFAYSHRQSWLVPTDGPVCSSPTIWGRYLFVGSDDGCLYALNTETGGRVWKYASGAPIRSTPAVHRNLVYFGNEAGDFYCLDFFGKQRWHSRAKRAITSSPYVGDELAIFASMDACLSAFDPRMGWEVWRFRMGRGSISSPSVLDPLVYLGAIDGIIYCVDIRNGREVWTFLTDHQVTGSPLAVDDVVYCGSVDGHLYSLNARTGKLKWKYRTKGGITGSPVLAEDILYIGSLDHKLYAFSP